MNTVSDTDFKIKAIHSYQNVKNYVLDTEDSIEKDKKIIDNLSEEMISPMRKTLKKQASFLSILNNKQKSK